MFFVLISRLKLMKTSVRSRVEGQDTLTALHFEREREREGTRATHKIRLKWSEGFRHVKG